MTAEERLIAAIDGNIEIRRVPVGDFFVNFVVTGQGDPLVLVHGGNIGWGQWYLNIHAFAKFFKVYAIDLPGGGRSSPINYRHLDIIKDFLNVAEQFIIKEGLQNSHIIGSSIGGWVSAKLALKPHLRIRKVILTDATGFSDHIRPSDRMIGFYPLAKILSRTLLRPHQKNKNIERFLRDVLYDRKFPLKKEFIDYFYETMSVSHNLLFISRLSKLFTTTNLLDLKDDLPHLENETLIIWGRHDKFLSPERCEKHFKLLPHAKIHIIESAGHIPCIEAAQEFNQIALSFLKA